MNLNSAFSDFGVQEVYSSGANLDQHVILSQLRVWHFANPHAVFFP